MYKTAVALLCFLAAPAAFSQSPAAPPAFEVAEVKANKSGEARLAVDFLPGGKLSALNVPMKVLIQMAYHVRPEAVTGGPGWLESERFDIVAKASPASSRIDLLMMLRGLLAERFKLAVHTEDRPQPAYALELSKSGQKMQASEAALLTDQRCVPAEGEAGQKHVACQHITMPVLAATLQEIAPRDITMPVVDQTGLAGSFSFKLDWVPAVRASANVTAETPPGPTLFEAVETQLGLKLENKKLPLPVVVIDHVERVPVEN